jgi:uncharacterized phage protein (TIGR01671 family)
MSPLRKGVYDKMRPLKFRQWVNDRFHYWGFLEKDCFTGPINPSDPSQQFTGLFSKSGKEIYEGDVIEIQNLPCQIQKAHLIGEVTFSSGGAWGATIKKVIAWRWYAPGVAARESIFLMNIVGGMETRVIGNIYELAQEGLEVNG